jgi:hypothetical protein
MLLWEVMIEVIEEFAKAGKDIGKDLINTAKDAVSPPKKTDAPPAPSNTGLIIACAAIFLFILLGFLLPHLKTATVPRPPQHPQAEKPLK